MLVLNFEQIHVTTQLICLKLLNEWQTVYLDWMQHQDLHCLLKLVIIILKGRYGRTHKKQQGPVVQSIVSLTRLLMVKMLSVLVSTISNSQLFLLKKCEFAKATHIFFQQKY